MQEALDLLDEGDYEVAYDRAMSALFGATAPGADLVPDLLEVAGCCCEHFRSTGYESDLPTAEDAARLTEMAIADSSDPVSTASVLSTLGRVYYDHGDYDKCERAMGHALDAVADMDFSGKSAFIPDHEYLVFALCQQGKFDEAEHAAQRWLSFAESELAENDIYTAKIHNTLGAIYREKDQPLLAEEHLRRCLWLHEKDSCLECADVPTALKNYADLLDSMGRNDEAEPLRQRASELEEDHQFD